MARELPGEGLAGDVDQPDRNARAQRRRFISTTRARRSSTSPSSRRADLLLHGDHRRHPAEANPGEDPRHRPGLPDLWEEHRSYFDIINFFLNSSSEVSSEQLKEQVDEHGNRIVDILAGVIADGIRSGDFRPVPPKRYALILWATIHGVTQLRKLRHTILRGEDLHKIYADAVELFIDAIGTAGAGQEASTPDT